jgi:hypothetical protein
MSFSSDVHRIAEKMGDTAENVASATFIELFSSVIKDTPVDSGRLQGNWQTTKNSPANGEVDRFGAASLIDVHTVIDKPGTYYLTNNLPYAERVEFDGWSHTKAPRGMVRINVKRLKQILRKQAK